MDASSKILRANGSPSSLGSLEGVGCPFLSGSQERISRGWAASLSLCSLTALLLEGPFLSALTKDLWWATIQSHMVIA